MQIRLARHDDRDAIWRILQPTLRAGETYALPSDMSEADAIAYWMGPDRETFVAEQDGVILGTYYLPRPNQHRRCAVRGELWLCHRTGGNGSRRGRAGCVSTRPRRTGEAGVVSCGWQPQNAVRRGVCTSRVFQCTPLPPGGNSLTIRIKCKAVIW